MESNIEYYNNLTVDKITEFLLSISSKKANNDRKFTIGCNKYGVLGYCQVQYEYLNDRYNTNINIVDKIKQLEETLDDCYYIIDENGWEKYGL